MKIGRER